MCLPGIHDWTRTAMALTERQEVKVQVCETNRVRRIVGIKRAMERIGGETLAKKADAQKMEGKEGN